MCICREGGEIAAARPPAQKGQVLYLTPDWGSPDLVSGRWNGEKGRVPKALRHPILPVTFTAWALGLCALQPWARGVWRGAGEERGWRYKEPFYGGKFLATMTQLPSHGSKPQLPHLPRKREKGTQKAPQTTFLIRQRTSWAKHPLQGHLCGQIKDGLGRTWTEC